MTVPLKNFAKRLGILSLLVCGMSAPMSAACAANQGKILEAYELLKSSKYERALPILSLIVEEDQANFLARRYLAYALLRSGKPLKSAEQILMLRGTPCSFDYYVLGEAYRNANRPVEAERCFQLVLARDPGYEAARAGLIRLYEQSGDTDKAMHQCILGRQLSTTDNSARFFSSRWVAVRSRTVKIKNNGKTELSTAQPAQDLEDEPIREISNNEAADLGISGAQTVQQTLTSVRKKRSGPPPPPPPPAPRSGPFCGSG